MYIDDISTLICIKKALYLHRKKKDAPIIISLIFLRMFYNKDTGVF